MSFIFQGLFWCHCFQTYMQFHLHSTHYRTTHGQFSSKYKGAIYAIYSSLNSLFKFNLRHSVINPRYIQIDKLVFIETNNLIHTYPFFSLLLPLLLCLSLHYLGVMFLVDCCIYCKFNCTNQVLSSLAAGISPQGFPVSSSTTVCIFFLYILYSCFFNCAK